MSNSLRPHDLYSPWNSLGQNAWVDSLSLLQRILPAQGSNPGLLHCRWILYQLSHKRSACIILDKLLVSLCLCSPSCKMGHHSSGDASAHHKLSSPGSLLWDRVQCVWWLWRTTLGINSYGRQGRKIGWREKSKPKQVLEWPITVVLHWPK